MTAGGGATEYAVPTDGAGLNGITTGLDGALWFAEGNADAVGRIAPGGEITEIPVGEGTMPMGIASGPDGAIWFSAPGSNQVGRLDVSGAPEDPPADETAPLVTIVSPPEGSILTEGEGMIADYSCVDEAGGSGLRSCDGPVPDGEVVPNDAGSHVFTVTGTDVAGNSATASHGYVVFEGIYGPITRQAVFKSGRTIPIILELGAHPRGPVLAAASPVVRAVDCGTHEASGADGAANVKAHLNKHGHLVLQWRTSAGWGGTCRSLVVRLGLDGWSSADAVFTLRFK